MVASEIKEGLVELSIDINFKRVDGAWRSEVEFIGAEMDDTRLFTRDHIVDTIEEALGYTVVELPGMALDFIRRHNGK